MEPCRKLGLRRVVQRGMVHSLMERLGNIIVSYLKNLKIQTI